MRKEIENLLQKNNINNYTIHEKINQYKLIFDGPIWVQQIIDLLDVLSWEYEGGKATFYVKGIG